MNRWWQDILGGIRTPGERSTSPHNTARAGPRPTKGKKGTTTRQELGGRIIHPALHLEDGWGSVGVLDRKGKWRIVTSHRQIYNADDIKDNLRPRPTTYTDLAGRWPDGDLQNFKKGEKAPTFGELMALIMERARATLELPRVEHYSLVAAWVVGTYFHRLFLAFPRLALTGERESGKSKTLALISTLSLNGLHRLAPTPAVIFRLIEAIRPTLCLDEMEGLGREDRQQILSIINSGYKAGGAVDRVEGKEMRQVGSFGVYAPMALAGIRGLNETTEDRAIPVILQRGTRLELLNAEIDPADPVLAQIRAGLYRLLLTRSGEVEQTYRTLPIPMWMNGRVRELWRPLLAITALADRDNLLGPHWDLLVLAKGHADDRPPISDEAGALIGILKTELGAATEKEFRPLDLCVPLEVALHRKQITPEYVGAMLRRLDFPRQRPGGRTRYTIRAEKLEELARRYHVPS